MKQKVCISRAVNEHGAVNEISAAFSGFSCNALLFFASTKYDFELISSLFHERFSNIPVMGTTTCGEISPEGGFSTDSVVATAISCPGTAVKAKAFAPFDNVLFVHRNDIERMAAECAITRNAPNAFALVFICALKNIEENVLALLHTALGRDFAVAGGSAGDDLKFEKTSVSCDGKVVSDGFALMLFKTKDKFLIQRENIFRSTGKALNITEVDLESRTILSIDKQTPLQRVAKIRGVSEVDLKKEMDLQFMGRIVGEEIFVSSMQSFNPNGTIVCYSRILPNTPVETLEVIDPLTAIKQTCNEVTEAIPKPGFVFLSNCIQRTMRFNNMDIAGTIRDLYNDVYKGNFAGFTTYGEQINRIHSNSTLVTLAVEG